MRLPEQVYVWLVDSAILANQGEVDEKGEVHLPASQAGGLESGFLIGQVLRRICNVTDRKVPSALANVKADSNKNAKLTNWSFIWLAFEAVGLKLDGRIRELILQGEEALIVEVLRQLRERDPTKSQGGKLAIRARVSVRGKAGGGQLDVKKINLAKDPGQSESGLQFLILLLRGSLGLGLEQILGLFANQNRYLSEVIVKGLNDSFQPVLLFYSLLNRHAQRLRWFYQQDSRDAEACLHAIRPGFISRSQKVAEQTLELFGRLGNLYPWFVGEGRPAGTLLIGLKRHPPLRQLYWHLLLEVIEGEELDFFTKHYSASFQSKAEEIEVTTYLLGHIALSFLGEKLANIGVAASWLEMAVGLAEGTTAEQSIAIGFMGELMLRLPAVIGQNQEALAVLSRGWEKRGVAQFVLLFNELGMVLEKLGEASSPFAERVFRVVVGIARTVGVGDRRDYLLELMLPLFKRFPSLPGELLVSSVRDCPLSPTAFTLACELLESAGDTETLLAVGGVLKGLFVESPLLNYELQPMLKEVVRRVWESEEGLSFAGGLLAEVLQSYGNLEVRYRAKGGQQKALYFLSRGSPEKVSKQESQELGVKERWKGILVGLAAALCDLAFSEQSQVLQELVRQKLLDANAYVRLHNHKVGSRLIEELLHRRFQVSKEEQVEHAQEFKQKAEAELEQSRVRRSKVRSQASLGSRLRGPENLVREFQEMTERRRLEQEQRQAEELRRQLVGEKRKLSVRKELEIANLLRGQVGEAQLREEGFLERLMVGVADGLVPVDQWEGREVEAVQAFLGRYHRLLRQLFLQYAGTMYSSYSAEAIEDNLRRKEWLSAAELGRMWKDYRLMQLTSQGELGGMVRDINVRLLGRREVAELDFLGFQQFVVQFCFSKIGKDRRRPIQELLAELVGQLKQAFIARGEQVGVFEHLEDVALTSEQSYEMGILNAKLVDNPSYILPKGYKKVVEKTVDFPYKISSTLEGLPQEFEVAIDALDFIFSKALKFHVIENIAVQKVNCRVRPNALKVGELQRQRTMSTVIDRKSALLAGLHSVNRPSGKTGRQVESDVEAGMAEMAAGTEGANEGEEARLAREAREGKVKKELVKAKKALSMAKLAEMEKARAEAFARRERQKEEQRVRQMQRKKSQERKRREQAQKYQQQQRAKLAERSKKEEEQLSKRAKEEEQRQALKKQNKEKFRRVQQGQIERIRKIEAEVGDRVRKEQHEQEEQREKEEELKRRLREKIEGQDRRIVEARRQIDRKLSALFESGPIVATFKQFQPNLKAIYDFLIGHTHLSLTEKKHNNEIVYDTWRYFLNAFEVSPLIVSARDVVFIFKSLTRDKIVPKEYIVGLNFEQFQQALLRIAVKYKTIFNLISEKIKDKVEDRPVQVASEKDIRAKKGGKEAKDGKDGGKEGKEGKEGSKQKEKTHPQRNASISKEQNEFDNPAELNIKELIRENNEGKDEIDEYGDLSKVNEKTLRGLIYYFKTPSNKQGQEARFRAILAEKHTASIQNAERLKEKLIEEYTLEQSSPKKEPAKVEGTSGKGAEKGKGAVQSTLLKVVDIPKGFGQVQKGKSVKKLK